MKKLALLSVTDKTGIVAFARFLTGHGFEILSTGGTAKTLRDGGVNVIDVSEHTGFPEMLDGRVKTLHPKIHGGLLGITKNSEHTQAMSKHDIAAIDLVAVNLYDFANAVSDPKCDLSYAIENIDIGGPSMIRSAAKNHDRVTVIVDPKDYESVQNEIAASGETSSDTRQRLALKAFQTTARYDTMIANELPRFLAGKKPLEKFPGEKISLTLERLQTLRYGENPHQAAGFYKSTSEAASGLSNATQLQGKELSFNNLLDADAAWACVLEFKTPACVIVKHNNPCGVATASELSEAFIKARSCDPVSSFGGIVAFNGTLDGKTALIMAETFFEVILATEFSEDALKILATKKNLRVLRMPKSSNAKTMDIRAVNGGFLLQDADNGHLEWPAVKTVTKKNPTAAEKTDLEFAWRVCKHVKSNAIIFVKNGATVGIGAGQMSRVDSVKIAGIKAADTFKNSEALKGCVLASDAFFPFRDGLDFAASYGITAVIQPGGSVRDEEVIQAANEHGISMVFTGMRHFRH